MTEFKWDLKVKYLAVIIAFVGYFKIWFMAYRVSDIFCTLKGYKNKTLCKNIENEYINFISNTLKQSDIIQDFQKQVQILFDLQAK